MSSHPMHGTKPQARALKTKAVFGVSPGVDFWKVSPPREGWGRAGGHLFIGSRSEAEERATRMGSPFAEVSRV